MAIDELSEEDIKGTPTSPVIYSPPISRADIAYNAKFLKAVETTLLDPRSKRAFKLYVSVMVGFLNAVSSGFDGSLMSGINATDQYLDYLRTSWHIYRNCFHDLPEMLSLLISIVGNVVDTFFYQGAFFILIGAAIIASAQNASVFLGGWFILGFGISISTTAAPTWVTELVPPQWRGRLGGFYNSCFFIGSILATGAMVGTQKMNSTWAWRLPLILQIFPPIIVMCCCWLCPESPRWYAQKGCLDKAREVLVCYHSNDGKTNPVIELQLKEFQDVIECVNGQLAGNGLTYFLPMLMSNAGVKSKHQQLVYDFMNSILSAFGTFSGAALSDPIGHCRNSPDGKLDNVNMTGANASIAMVFLFGVVYSFMYTPLQVVYCAEVLQQDIHAKGMGIHILISNVAGFINTFGNSFGLGCLGWKYYFMFVRWDLVASVLWFLFCVETMWTN
ncbi:MFS general substrate transporter [Armillaria gallica]|uniref:MFS general substrate transporter n=1 Tax=Armillaria gallica TaxID=47427 RepID=A0A2H3DD02_ARMGA|nr:MFS general substrate transporter [Armillaria gallica]